MKPSIQICSLETVQKIELSSYSGVITIENSTIENPFRVENGTPEQLILKFDDISSTMDDYIKPQKFHIKKALSFANKVDDGTLLIHCHAGISRSSAIALAIITESFGAGRESDAVEFLAKINPNARPNKSLILMTDEMLGREMALFKTVSNMMQLTIHSP